MDAGVLVILLNVSFVAVMVVAFLLMRRKLVREHTRRMRELAAPLLPNSAGVDHRLDTATREAKKGFNVCAVCAFENFKDAPFCSICGERMELDPSPPQEAAQGTRAYRKQQKQLKKQQQRAKTTAALPRPKTQLTERQLRARKRKEWVRKLDVDGHLYWYRTSRKSKSKSKSSSKEPLAPARVGRVVRFVKSEDSAKMPHQPQSEPATQSEVTVVEAAKKPFVDVAEMEIVPAATWDAARRSTGETLESEERTREVLALADLDFPSKYAQFVANTAALLVPAEVEFLKLSIHRDYVLEESMEHLSCIEERYVRSVLRINFLEESGVDAGGLQREWFMLLTELLTNPHAGLFTCVNDEDGAFYLNPNSRFDNGDEHLVYYYATGRLLGRALLEGTVLNFHLCAPLLKLILGTPLCLDDVRDLNPALYRSLAWLLEHDDVESLGLDFTVCERVGEKVETVELVPNGRQLCVTDANKHEFLERKMERLLLTSVAEQLYVFLKGLYEVIPPHLLLPFDYEELDYLLCGSAEIDVDDWQQHADVAESIGRSPTIAWFWELVREMPNEYRRRLLQFTTGCSRVPLVGFQGLMSYDGRLCRFTVRGIVGAPDPFVRSYACFNRIDLPLGTSRQELKDMLYATLDTELYGFTTD